MLILTIIALFIVKGPHPPLSEPFMWFYRNMVGFKVFRRPVSKYYSVFLLFYLTLSFIGLTAAIKKLKPEKQLVLVKIPLILASLYFLLAFIDTKELTPFDIPAGYRIALSDLKKNSCRQNPFIAGPFHHPTDIQHYRQSALCNRFPSILLAVSFSIF